jgi:predicted nucleic acid-binding Zn finger protein
MLRFVKPGFGTILPEDARAHEEWIAELTGHDYVIEGWHCDLSTGIFSVGEMAQRIHALEQGLCGLLDIIRGYAENHHKIILSILEEATAVASSFCYCADVVQVSAGPLYCIGTSTIDAAAASGRMQGVFAFSTVDR